MAIICVGQNNAIQYRASSTLTAGEAFQYGNVIAVARPVGITSGTEGTIVTDGRIEITKTTSSEVISAGDRVTITIATQTAVKDSNGSHACDITSGATQSTVVLRLNQVPGDSSGSVSVAKFATVAEMIADRDLADNAICTTAGYTTAGDGGGNEYIYHSTGAGSVTADGGFYILSTGVSGAYFEAKDKYDFNVRKFGAVGDGTIDDTDAFTNCISAQQYFSHGSRFDGTQATTPCSCFLDIPAGVYRITDTLYIPGGMLVKGRNFGGVHIKFRPASSKDLFAGDTSHYSRNTHWWLNTFENLIIGGDYIESATPYARRCFNLDGMHNAMVNRCWVEGFQSGLYGYNGQEYYIRVTNCNFEDNELHVEQLKDDVGGGCQPLWIENTLFFLTASHMDLVGTKPTEMIYSERALHLVNVSIESGTSVGTDFVKVRCSGPVTGYGIYTEGAHPLFDVDCRLDVAHIDVSAAFHPASGARLLRLRNYFGNDATRTYSTTSRPIIRTNMSQFRHADLLYNSFAVWGDTGFTKHSDTTYQTTIHYPGFPGAWVHNATTTAALQPVLQVSGLDASKYAGQRLFFSALVKATDSDYSTHRYIQIQDATATPYQVCEQEVIDYGNGWKLYVMDYDVPDDTAFVFTANAGTNVITATGHAFANGAKVRLTTTTTLPAGLATGTDYYVVSTDTAAGTLQLSASSGGAAIDITDAGTGTHYIAYKNETLTLSTRVTPTSTGKILYHGGFAAFTHGFDHQPNRQAYLHDTVKPRVIQLSGGFIWIDSTGDVRVATTLPTALDSDGTVVGTQT